jgi:hypothetical protein
VDDASPVRRRERLGQLDRKVEEGWEWKSAGLDECLERLPFHELHGEEADAGVLLDRVGMIEEGDRARLALEARESARVLGHMLYIDGDFTSVAGVARNHISKLSFNGAALSLTLYDPSATNGMVNALQVYDNYLYAEARFST